MFSIQYHTIFSDGFLVPENYELGESAISTFGGVNRLTLPPQHQEYGFRKLLRFHLSKECTPYPLNLVGEALKGMGAHEDEIAAIRARVECLMNSVSNVQPSSKKEEKAWIESMQERAQVIDHDGIKELASELLKAHRSKSWDTVKEEKVAQYLSMTEPAVLDTLMFGCLLTSARRQLIPSCVSGLWGIGTRALTSSHKTGTDLDMLFAKRHPDCIDTETELFPMQFSVCYRSINLCISQLLENLKGNKDLALLCIRAFTESLLYGSYASSANDNCLSHACLMIAEIIKEEQPVNYKNAFRVPVDKFLSVDSAVRLNEYINKVDRRNPQTGIQDRRFWIDLSPEPLPNFAGIQTDNLNDLTGRIEDTINAILKGQ